MQITQEQLNEIVRKHGLWLKNNDADSRANLSGADLSGADLSGANLSGANLSGANMSRANLLWAGLSRANLSGANMSWADMSRANMSWANMSRANLLGADLSGANLLGANLSRANLSGANLTGANLTGAKLSARTKIVSVSGVGSSRRLTNYRIDTDEVWCGCFKGTLTEFGARVKETRKDNLQHLADYKAAIAFFKAAKKSFDAMNTRDEVLK